MAYERSDYRSGNYGDPRERERGRFGQERGYGRGQDFDDDRGFFDRAGDEVRSWFGDEEAERRREEDQRRFERERGYEGYGGSDFERGRGERWRERGWRGPGDYGRRPREADRSYGGRSGEDYAERPDTAGEFWAGSGSGGYFDQGQRFDRIDAGSTGTHGAHARSAPIGGGSENFGVEAAGYGGTARTAAIYEGAGRYGSRAHDPHYSEWRRRQIDALDRDYEDYRREHQSKFEQEFGSWREKRRGQRQLLGRVTEHMEVIGSDGQHIGTVDKVHGDRILLTRSDPSAGGHHHSIPCDWVDRVEDKVTITKSAEEARNAWRDEETSRALFEREDSGSEGPRVLGRSFSGTY